MIEIIIVILFAVWNGLVIRWHQTGKGSDLWHAVGWVVRLLPVFLLYQKIELLLIYINLAWTVYDMIINLVNGWNLFYIGKTSTLDRVFGKWLYLCKGLLLVLTIIVVIYG